MTSDGNNNGWFKSCRHQDALELLAHYPLALVMAYYIAYRARWHEGYDGDGIRLGETILGNPKALGMSARQYRTSIEKLSKGGFATFRATNRATIGKLTDTRLFDVLNLDVRRAERRPADDQPTSNRRLTKNLKNLEEGKAAPDLSLAHRDAGLLVKDKQRMEREIESLRQSDKPDRREIIRGLRASIRQIEDEFKRRAPRPAEAPKAEPKTEAPAKPVPVLTGADVDFERERLTREQQWRQAVDGDRPGY